MSSLSAVSTSFSAGRTSTWALSVARLTVAVTPGSFFNFFSTRATHDEHVIPVTARSSSIRGSPSVSGVSLLVSATVFIRLLPHNLLRLRQLLTLLHHCVLRL